MEARGPEHHRERAPDDAAAQQVSWVYRRGDEVWVYRARGDAAPDAAAAEVARLRVAIEAVPPDGAPAPAVSHPPFRWTWLLIGVLTGFLVGVLLAFFLPLLAAGRAEPTSMVGFGGALLGIVAIRDLPETRAWPIRRIALAFWGGLVVFTGSWFMLGDSAVQQSDTLVVGTLSLLSHGASLACVMVGVKWLHDALDTTIIAEAGPLMTVFIGTVSVASALLLFLRGAGQALASTDLDVLVAGIFSLILSMATMVPIAGLLLGRQVQRLPPALVWSLAALLFVTAVQFLADFSASVTVALYGTRQADTDFYMVAAQDSRVLFLAIVYAVVVYVWGLAVLLIPLGASPPLKRSAPAAEVEARVDDLVLHWKSE